MLRATFALDISESFILVCTRRSLELHVSDIVACLDDNPSMQVNLESLSVSSIFVEQVSVVRLLGRIGCKETAAIGILAPDSGSVSTEQLLQLRI
jgi:hypothetical protein